MKVSRQYRDISKLSTVLIYFRTSLVYVFWKKVDGLLRSDVETIQNIARNLLTRAQIARKDTDTPNPKEKLDGHVIRTTTV